MFKCSVNFCRAKIYGGVLRLRSGLPEINTFKVIRGDKNYLTEPAIGTYLMNFYNGIENIIKRIAKEYYKKMPSGASWHKELIILAINPPNKKLPAITENLKERIGKYTNFRHRFVSGYGFQLEGEKMMELINGTQPLWEEIKKQL